MKFTGKSSNEYDGLIDLMECECGHEQTQPSGSKPIAEVVCRKCRKKSKS